MIEVGGRPILWHIMKGYAANDITQFVIALGYKGEVIKEFFLNYQALAASSLRVETATGTVQVESGSHDDWRVDLVDTGELTNTGGRLKRLERWLPDDTFCLTYGDGVCDVNVDHLVAFHRSHGRIATVTAVRPPARFGGLDVDEKGLVTAFSEKPQVGEGWINGGFMVFNKAVFAHIAGDEASLERDVLEPLAEIGELAAYRHHDYWQCMDTLRDVRLLREKWAAGEAPWRTWS